MANFTEVPEFIKGEPGFAAKLNVLGNAIRELQAAFAELEETAKAVAPVIENAAKTTTRRKATAPKAE
jgi:outer membrane murein-binding lipoprotein Lpp